MTEREKAALYHGILMGSAIAGIPVAVLGLTPAGPFINEIGIQQTRDLAASNKFRDEAMHEVEEALKRWRNRDLN